MKHIIFFLSLLYLPNLQGSQNEEVHYHIPTSQGSIAIWDSQGNGQPILLVHSNSTSGQLFKKQFQSILSKKYRLIAPDLPAHGDSDITTIEENHSLSGYAHVLAEIITKLGLTKVTIVGFALGGHIALELYQTVPHMINGVLITGAPPIKLSQEGLNKGFKPLETSNLLYLLEYESELTENEAKFFITVGGFDAENSESQFIIDSVIKVKGIIRKYLLNSIKKGIGHDETNIVANMHVPLAIIAGEYDTVVNNHYLINEIKYGNLWNNEVHIINKGGHAVFWEKADEFNAILDAFLEDIHKNN
jgi:pimeloyl-ACP methyl ester carboxylesterase